MNTQTEEQRRAKRDADVERAFKEWMARSETKLLLSLIPASENQGIVACTLLEAILDNRVNKT